MKQLVILAGGKGTRLKAISGDRPKPLIDVCGRPLLEHQILLAKKHGFTDIIITTHHQAESIRDFCSDGSKWSVQIRYLEEKRALGTAGGVLANLDIFAERFLVMYGDTMLNVNLCQLWKFHGTHHPAATLFLHPNDHPHDSDLVEVDNNARIVAFHPYPHPAEFYFPNLVNAALYVINKNSLLQWAQLPIPENGMDFAKHLFPLMIKANQELLGYNSPEYIKDVGTPDRIAQVSNDFYTGKIQRRSIECANTAIFIDRDGTLTQQTDYVTTPEQLALIPGSAKAIRQINQHGHLAILVTNQPIIARGDCSEPELKQIHNKLETLLGHEGAFLDGIYYCPHHPDKGFTGERSEYKISCECRKPNIGMLTYAQQYAPIDMQQSWFIGDSTVDMQTAKNAGLKSMLVRSGMSGCDDKYAARPDFESYDLTTAVNFIYHTFPDLFTKATYYAASILAGEKVVIGGLARSGKSTWASLFKLALAKRNIPTVIISLDGWIKNMDERENGNILSRHNLAAICQLIETIENAQDTIEIQVPVYNRLKQCKNRQEETFLITPDHVILYEGVSAFLLDKLLQHALHHFYVNTADNIRMANFKKEYQLRGLSDQAIQALYRSREQDENALIRSSPAIQRAIILDDALPNHEGFTTL